MENSKVLNAYHCLKKYGINIYDMLDFDMDNPYEIAFRNANPFIERSNEPVVYTVPCMAKTDNSVYTKRDRDLINKLVESMRRKQYDEDYSYYDYEDDYDEDDYDEEDDSDEDEYDEDYDDEEFYDEDDEDLDEDDDDDETEYFQVGNYEDDTEDDDEDDYDEEPIIEIDPNDGRRIYHGKYLTEDDIRENAIVVVPTEEQDEVYDEEYEQRFSDNNEPEPEVSYWRACEDDSNDPAIDNEIREEIYDPEIEAESNEAQKFYEGASRFAAVLTKELKNNQIHLQFPKIVDVKKFYNDIFKISESAIILFANNYENNFQAFPKCKVKNENYDYEHFEHFFDLIVNLGSLKESSTVVYTNYVEAMIANSQNKFKAPSLGYQFMKVWWNNKDTKTLFQYRFNPKDAVLIENVSKIIRALVI